MSAEGPRFFFKILFLAALGTAVIVFGLPFLPAQALPDPVHRGIAALDRIAPLGKAATAVRTHLSWRELSPPPAPAAPPAAKPIALAPLPAPSPPPAEAAVTNAAPEPPSARAAPATPAPAPEAPTVARPVAPPKPSPAAKERWGLVVEPDTRMHNSLGKFLRRVEPGVLISIVKTVESNAGRFARGKVLADGETIEDALLPLDALEVFEGSLDALTPRQRRLFSQRAAVEAEIKARKAATGKFLREDNPHATAYAQVRDRYVEHLRTARELQARRDRAVGREREQLIAQLQEMRSSDVEFSQEYAQTKARYEAWNAANPVPTGPAAAAIRALEKKLAEIESELSEQPEG